jgi:hypothetical protein
LQSPDYSALASRNRLVRFALASPVRLSAAERTPPPAALRGGCRSLGIIASPLLYFAAPAGHAIAGLF